MRFLLVAALATAGLGLGGCEADMSGGSAWSAGLRETASPPEPAVVPVPASTSVAAMPAVSEPVTLSPLTPAPTVSRPVPLSPLAPVPVGEPVAEVRATLGGACPAPVDVAEAARLKQAFSGPSARMNAAFLRTVVDDRVRVWKGTPLLVALVEGEPGYCVLEQQGRVYRLAPGNVCFFDTDFDSKFDSFTVESRVGSDRLPTPPLHFLPDKERPTPPGCP